MAERVLVSLEEAYLTFGGKPLFENLRLHIAEGDRICLVGRNGAGKTTLMRLITGEIELDGGTRFALPGLSIGYLAQNVPFRAEDSVHAFVMSGLPEAERSEDKHHLADIVIAPLGLATEALCGTLSGGQLRRAALARALVAEPELLLLDEPTNHLDLDAIQWLEGYLSYYRGAVLCVSHDRAFLKAISKKTFWIDRRMMRVCPRGYGYFDEWAETVVEQEARELSNMQKKLAAEVDWTQGGVTGRRKRNIRRLNELYRLRDKLKSDKAAFNQRMRAIEAGPMETAQASKVIVEFKAVSKAFGEGKGRVPILEDFSLRIVRGDRIGVIGRNGSGKSTFIKLLTGEIPADSGFIKRGKTIDITYFDQSRSQLNPDKTLWDTLVPGGGDYVFLGSEAQKPVHVCGYLKSFLFDPRMARDRVSTLSGGQQNRLMLAKALAAPGNVLILDEPTNDLDMDTLDMLQEMLADYDGTLIIVSHDRDFLDRTVTEVLAFEGDAKVDGCFGGYSDYLAMKENPLPSRGKVREGALDAKTSPSQALLPASPLLGEEKKSRLPNKLRHELEKLPGRIAALEAELTTLREALLDPQLYHREPERFDAASRRIALAEGELEEAELRWLELEEMRAAAG